MGRPEKFKQPKGASFRLEKELYNEVEKIRWREHADFGEIIRRAVEDYVKAHAEGNETFKMTDFQDPDFVAIPATMAPIDKWDKFIRQHMTIEERKKLDKRFIDLRKTINAANYKDTGVSERL